MRIVLRFLLFLVPVLALATFASVKVMEMLSDQWLSADLARRSQLISSGIEDYLTDNLKARKVQSIRKVLNRISRDERLTGAALCSARGELLAKNDRLPKGLDCDPAWGEIENRKPSIVRTAQLKLHKAVFPVTDGEETLAYLVVYHDTSYMTQRHETTSKYVVALLVLLSLSLFAITMGIYRWSMTASVKKLKEVFQGLITGEMSHMDERLTNSEFSPLARDFKQMMRELRHAKDLVKDSESGLTWTPSRLRQEVQKYFGDAPLCVIANREPYVHNRKGNKVEVMFPASGLVTAVEPIVRACSGLWIAHGSGSADRETADPSGKLLVPPGNPEYMLKRVWLTKAEEQGYYYGFSNEGLWPLCHIAHTRPYFDSADWAQYKAVNEKFARAFSEENPGEKPVVLIQDYHFALLPQLIRAKKPDAVVSLFWHIPWPNPESIGICPWRRELLEGMLGADLIGFHTQFHCNNFLDTVDRFLEARVDRENFSVTIQGHVCHVKPFAISVEWPARFDVALESFAAEKAELLTELNLPAGTKIGIGVDRVDYTKGLVERLRAVEKLLDRHPELVGKFTFVQIGAPSRTHIKRYQDLNHEVAEVADRINWKFAGAEVPPITLKLSHHNAPELYRYYRAADLCFVSSLHDGMNLVAKEYVSAHKDNDGVLILSNFTGASRELNEALLVNPYDIDECGEALYQALTMPQALRQQRMERMRATVAERNVYAWAGSFLAEIHRIAQLKTSGVSGPRPDYPIDNTTTR